METISNHERMYLARLNTMSGGDPEVQVSMYEVGEALGLEKAEAGQMAETLFIGGYAELKTLSGGIGITAMGLDELGMSAPVKEGGLQKESLGKDPVLQGPFLETVLSLITELKSAVPKGKLSFEQLEEVLMDMKTIEVQLLSPRPKTEVVREVFRSLGQALKTPGVSEIRARLDRAVADR